MSMYLPNPDVGPTGVEPGEFIDFPPTAEELGILDGGGRLGESADSRPVAHDALASKQPTEKASDVQGERQHTAAPGAIGAFGYTMLGIVRQLRRQRVRGITTRGRR